MKIIEILNRYAGKSEIRKIYKDRHGVKTSARLPQVQWEAIEKYCVKHRTTPATFMMALDLALGDDVNYSSALRYVAIYIMEHPEDEVEFLVNK